MLIKIILNNNNILYCNNANTIYDGEVGGGGRPGRKHQGSATLADGTPLPPIATWGSIVKK